MEPNKQAIDIAKEYGFDQLEHAYSKEGFDVFTPVYVTTNGKAPITGEPIYIIQKGESSYAWQGVGEPLLLSELPAKK